MRTPLALTLVVLVGCASDPPRQLAPDPPPAPAPARRTPSRAAQPATPAVVDSGDAWARCKVGAEFVQHRVMVTKPPLVPVTTEARYVTTIVAMDDHSVTIRTRSESTSAPPDERQEVVPRGARAHPPGERDEATVTVPAGTFPCVHVKSTAEEGGATWTFDEWYDPTLPVPYRIEVEGPREKQTMELVSFELE